MNSDFASQKMNEASRKCRNYDPVSTRKGNMVKLRETVMSHPVRYTSYRIYIIYKYKYHKSINLAAWPGVALTVSKPTQTPALFLTDAESSRKGGSSALHPSCNETNITTIYSN
ncbi:hypothetical protein AVEN_210016-1 [Araneus ventricosus]|uniref:Uncharacterized protein n=1 Tax=Araneus ventricosus TaxID=182803 RepID=A0A4Y2IB17_ARAVE|nr:hypothetical protein AVEN_210016-1 [Araneus ventricosus]